MIKHLTFGGTVTLLVSDLSVLLLVGTQWLTALLLT